ncbi:MULTISPECIES: hypothetical protein [Ramlibacter]|uniref:Uncharacterized protein n=1 Tax=Ramlibacter pinisoli TaxID=2682844 RepID=A0A6N8IWT2_9BURK|nr:MULTISPECIES: hypothetical protein [Ramlibacter]MBA2961071.1 hypothetical protein [Ramlibacter sp. CGMCC 1.13660]MVQ31015.1 hypothetical protein [Ramlibacter pinisoli]
MGTNARGSADHQKQQDRNGDQADQQTSGQGAASALARFMTQREQRRRESPPEAPSEDRS